ncbi:DUF3093 domain-containing protein [Leucobacter luti]|uniref:DUF3093 family protein n=1 Tax=Leucobacter luti TaxID=340320 RepID=A0A4Q7TKV0_9MICO|nr:DUF3093 domain-containing protein [Leucobacter luti]MBL3700379.1 DUF3093 domain-containing protein [Leucobacter luti]RZT60550.1 DUF3093 family protein [Leucobacter luti]
MTSDVPASSAAPASPATPAYRERLVPGPGLFLALLLLVPAVALITTPINAALAIPVGVLVFLIAAITLLLLAPTVRVVGDRLVAGHAEIPVAQLGDMQLLGSEALRAAIGPGLDARSFLLVRGWIHRGVKIDNIDPADPAPYWIITTRHPQKLADAIRAARS